MMRTRLRHVVPSGSTGRDISSVPLSKRRHGTRSVRPSTSCGVMLFLVASVLIASMLMGILSFQSAQSDEKPQLSSEQEEKIMLAFRAACEGTPVCANISSIHQDADDDNESEHVNVPPAVCRHRWYYTQPSSELPSADLVITVTPSTCLALMLRTVALALSLSSPQLLPRVWISTSTDLPSSTVAALNSLARARVLSNPPGLSVAALRDNAAARVRSPVVVFLSPGSVPYSGWLEPLLGELAEDVIKRRRDTIALPAEPPARRGAPPPAVGHDWALNPLTFPRVHLSGFASEAYAAHTPLLPHGDFAVRSSFWRQVGGYDDAIGDTELALRTWSCGGAIATIPCSRVVRPEPAGPHNRHHHNHYPHPHNHNKLHRAARLEVAQRWMGPYAILNSFANNEYPNATYKIPEERCPGGFRGYMGAAFPEMQSSAQIMLGSAPQKGLRAWGKLRLFGRSTCVSLSRDGSSFIAAKCARASVMLMSRSGYLMAAPKLTATCVTRKDRRLMPTRCDVLWSKIQHWELVQKREASIFVRLGGTPQCLTAVPGGKLAVAECLPERARKQTWVWEFRGEDDGIPNDTGWEQDGAIQDMTPPAFASSPLIGSIPSTRATTLRCSAQPPNTNANVDRRSVLRTGAALFALQVLPAYAARRPGTMSGDYKSDAAKMLEDMKLATDLGRGAEGAVETVTRTRTEMNDFVALYRRNDKVAGSTSFNTLYTAINTLSGHYASYGNAYPVPEKRKKRLNQQYTEIERALTRGR